jgi:hypothetical protein
LYIRIQQLELLSEDIEEAVLRKQRYREASKLQFDRSHNIEQKEIRVGDIVLYFNQQTKINISNTIKLSYCWLGPFRVTYADPIKGTYKLVELDGTPLYGTFASKRLKKYFLQNILFIPTEDPGSNE